MDAFLFVLGLALIVNTIYGFALWTQAMPPGPRRTANVAAGAIGAVVMFPAAALVMLGYVPWRVWRHTQLAPR
jgi:hypothetical protein